MELLRDTFKEKHLSKYIVGLIGYNDGIFYAQAACETLDEALEIAKTESGTRSRVPWVVLKLEEYIPTSEV